MTTHGKDKVLGIAALIMERRRLHWKESSTIAAIRELGLERLEAVCSLWIVAVFPEYFLNMFHEIYLTDSLVQEVLTAYLLGLHALQFIQ